MITLYGSRPTRSFRAAWMLEELGLEYELLDNFDPRSAEFLGHNPNGKLPTLVDDGRRRARGRGPATLARLEAELSKHDHLLGPDFTVADLNVASVVHFGRYGQCDFGPFPKVDAWHRRCTERPAFQRMSKLPMMPLPPPG
jgi:glutathione S-transferase